MCTHVSICICCAEAVSGSPGVAPPKVVPDQSRSLVPTTTSMPQCAARVEPLSELPGSAHHAVTLNMPVQRYGSPFSVHHGCDTTELCDSAYVAGHGGSGHAAERFEAHESCCAVAASGRSSRSSSSSSVGGGASSSGGNKGS